MNHDSGNGATPQPAAAPTTMAPAVAPGEVEIPVFDRASFLERMMHDLHVARIVIEGFLAETPNRIETLVESLASSDLSEAVRQAHTIKGASATVCAEGVRRIAAEMEAMGRVGNLAAMSRRLPLLQERFAALRTVLIGFDLEE